MQAPMNYYGMYPQNPYMAPQMPQMAQPAQQTQTRTVEVIPVPNEAAIAEYPVPAGMTLEFIVQGDGVVAFKSNPINGQGGVEYYDRRPPAPPAPAFDPNVYVRRDELPALLADLARPSRVKKEAADV